MGRAGGPYPRVLSPPCEPAVTTELPIRAGRHVLWHILGASDEGRLSGMSELADTFDAAFSKAVDLGNRIADKDKDADLWTLPTGYSPAPSSTGSTPASPVAIRAARTACRSAPRRAAWRSSTASSSSSLPRASTSTPRPTPTPAGRRRHTRIFPGV